MWKLDHKESWAPKNWRFWTVVLEKPLESPLDCKEIKPINVKGNQLWIFTEGLVLELKLQYFGHLMQKANSLGNTLMLGKIEGQKVKGAAENEMVRYNHQLNGYEFEQTPGDSEGQGSLVCCRPWRHKESDMTYWLNNKNNTSTSLTWLLYLYSIMDWIFEKEKMKDIPIWMQSSKE